jgi:predicted dehydrogenase
MNRRKFLKRGAAAVGAVSLPWIVPSTVFGKGGGVVPSERIVMGCIGLGGQGLYDMRAFMGKDASQVVAVCDVDKSHLAKASKLVSDKYGNKDCAEYGDFREVLSRKDIDAVLIATPDHWHGLITVAAAKAGKDIYCEKPLTNTIKQGRAVVDAVKRYGRVLQTGTQRRSNSACRFACELARNGRLGKMERVRSVVPEGYWVSGGFSGEQPEQPVPEGFDYKMWLGPAPYAPYTKARCHFNFRWIRDYSAGYITDWGAHFVDIAQWGIGADGTGPVKAEGWGEFPEKGLYNAATKHRVEFTYSDGVKVISESSSNKDDYGIHFEGSEGRVSVMNQIFAADPGGLVKEKFGPGDVHLYNSNDHHGNFLECVKSRQATTATAEIGHRTATICNLASIVVLTGKKIEWDPVNERITNDAALDRLTGGAVRKEWQV